MEVMMPRAGVRSGSVIQTRRSFVAGLSAALLHSRTKATPSSGPGTFDEVGHFEMYWPDRGPQPPATETLLHEYSGLAFPPGAVYEYSNIGYGMIGAVASKLTGQEFGTLMTKRILEPLGLHDSFFGTDRIRPPDRALQYEAAGKVLPYYTTATPPSGELFVSAHDLARFAIFNLNGILGRAATLLVYLVPSHDLSCVVLTNRSDNHGFAIGIVDEILGSLIPGWNTPEARPDGRSSPFVARTELRGWWEGELSGGGAKMRSALESASGHDATFSLDGDPPERISNLLSQQGGLIGNTVGKITAAEAVRTHSTNLALKLIPHENRLVGRVIATAEQPGTMLPYMLSLVRVREN
jgi:hypothetical protein